MGLDIAIDLIPAQRRSVLEWKRYLSEIDTYTLGSQVKWTARTDSASHPAGGENHGHVLTPGRYVRVDASKEKDETPFKEWFTALQTRQENQFAEAEELTVTIYERLARLFPDV